MDEGTYLATLEFRDSDTAEVEREHLVCLQQTELQVLEQGSQGPPGPPGPAAGEAVQRAAGETVSALRVLFELDGAAYLLDYRDQDHINLILGISLTAASLGDSLNVQRSGVIEDASWAWTPGRVWLGVGGALTQVPPVDGFDVLIGSAVSQRRILMNIQDPIGLED